MKHEPYPPASPEDNAKAHAEGQTHALSEPTMKHETPLEMERRLLGERLEAVKATACPKCGARGELVTRYQREHLGYQTRFECYSGLVSKFYKHAEDDVFVQSDQCRDQQEMNDHEA